MKTKELVDCFMKMNERDCIMNMKELADSIRSPMFASRKTIKEAYDYSSSVIESFPKEIRIYAYTALQVLVNSITDEIERRAK